MMPLDGRPRKKSNRVYAVGSQHPRWLGGERAKVCGNCGKTFCCTPPATYATFRKQKFCSPICGWRGRKERYGPEHHNWRPDARRRNRGGPHKRWRDAVIARDGATCTRCVAQGVEVHAHHIKPYKEYPELRFDVDNGMTLCFRCHWAEHTALTAKAVKSGDTLSAGAEGNPEPSQRGNLLEGVTTRGRAYRRWVGTCFWCGTPISKSISDTRGKWALFCGKVCMGKGSAYKRGFIQGPLAVTPPRAPLPKGMI